ncbi:probable glycerol-3-phosphate acyltransferase 3 [Oryza brachyantha]|uniref:probable glycerol-3-phosphate acyltransferase 3 n=1 Tax=Oryza brachyantha TaxID=4533 RepID=UPI001ADC7551|nr:probable glycerol-3-phosphate acyltransferase 3 [Oryza brachyantha]
MASEPSSGHTNLYRFVRRWLANPPGHHHHHLRRSASTGISTTYPARIIPRCPTSPPSSAQDGGGGRDRLRDATMVLDVEGALLRSSSPSSSTFFPYLMLVAVEAGSFLRGFILLCVHLAASCLAPLLPEEARLRATVMACFFGLQERKVARVARATLPKHFLEDVGMEGHEAARAAKRVVAVSRAIPRVLVRPFLEDYLGFDAVVGREVKVVRGFYVGLLGKMMGEGRLGLEEDLDDGAPADMVGFGSGSGCSSSHGHHHLFSRCKEIYLVTPEEKRKWSPLPRDQYPKPLIFHDGRLAFRPTPEATLAMFLWLPFSLPLTIFRTFIFVTLPYPISVAIGSIAGVRTRVINPPVSNNTTTTPTGHAKPGDHQQPDDDRPKNTTGRLYVCNHRTLLDPIYISAMLNKKVSAVTYSVSRLTEWISPIPTIRLTRDRDEDRRRMERALQRGDLVVCPEGTTCREPYLLRFSPLSLELVDEVHLVALVNWSGMFYGNSTGRCKWLDSFYYFMNPRPAYDVQFMEKMPTRMVVDGKTCESKHVANMVQGEIGRVLGFECTKFTREKKYLALAGNKGVVDANQ